MSLFLVYDPIVGEYTRTFATTTPRPQDAKHWRRLHAARERASLMNVNRNIPPGHSGPSRYYRDLPNVVVHEFGEGWTLDGVHIAPPSYIFLTTSGAPDD